MTAADKHLATTNTATIDPSDLSVDDSLPSTTVTEIDIAQPRSTTSSLSTTTSILPKPTQTATSAAQEPTLQSLNDDILSRIASHLLLDSRRGTPHYPSKEAPDALAFAQTSAMLSDAVARHLTSDHPWLDVSEADTDRSGLKASFKQKVLAWYTVAAPHLTSLHLHAKLTYFPDLRARVMDKLLDFRPPLKFVNLSSFDKIPEPSNLHTDLAELLKYARETITTITLDLTPKLLDVVSKARLVSVTTMDVKVGPFAPSVAFVKLLKSVSSRASPLTHLTIRTIRSLPEEFKPQKLYAAAPYIQSLEYHDSGMENTVESLKSGFLRFARCFRDIRSISLYDCQVDLASVHSFLDREKYPLLDNLEFINCMVYDLHAVLAAASDRVTRLVLKQQVDRAALQGLARCKKIRELGLAMERDVVEGLKDCLTNLRELRGLTLTLPSGGPRVERHVIEALEHTKENFQKFVLQGETLQYEGIRHSMRVLGPQLQYWVTGIYTPTKSRTKIIMRLLKDTAEYNPNMKVLCFGLGLTYDRKGAELHEEFLRSIEVVGSKLRGLDTYWLKRNARSILELGRPQDFEDYESDQSDVEAY